VATEGEPTNSPPQRLRRFEGPAVDQFDRDVPEVLGKVLRGELGEVERRAATSNLGYFFGEFQCDYKRRGGQPELSRKQTWRPKAGTFPKCWAKYCGVNLARSSGGQRRTTMGS
jgi:hypothetical protein